MSSQQTHTNSVPALSLEKTFLTISSSQSGKPTVNTLFTSSIVTVPVTFY